MEKLLTCQVFPHKKPHFIVKERQLFRRRKVNKLSVSIMTGLILVCTSISWATLTEGLVSYWSFDDSSNPGHDDSGNGSDGTVHGATWTAGKFGGALNFDGDD